MIDAATGVQLQIEAADLDLVTASTF
jgi:hypothetical protein